MGAGLPRAAQHRRADQEGRRRPERPRAHRPDLRARRLPLDRQAGPALPDAVVRPVHATQAGRAGRAHRLGGARGARGRVLHDADPHRRRPADERAAARDRVGERAVRTRRRRRHRPAERAAALDPHRGRAGDLRTARSGRAHDAGGVRRHAARDPRLPARRRHGRRGAGRHARHPRRRRAVPGRPRVLEPAAQVQDVDQRLPRALHEPRDQRHLVRGRRSPDARARIRPAGRRRPVDEPDVRPTARRVRRAGSGCPTRGPA